MAPDLQPEQQARERIDGMLADAGWTVQSIEALLQFMKREGINRSELAERMGVGPSRITKMLSGDENLTIDTLVRAGQAVGADLAQTFVPEGQKGRWVCHPKPKGVPK